MTRADVIAHFEDVMRLHGFVGANAQLPATSEDVTGLFLQIAVKAEELIETLERYERRSPDGDGPELPSRSTGQAEIKEPRHNALIAGEPEEEQRGQQTAGDQGRGGQPLTVNAGDGLCNSGPRHTNAHRLAVQGAGSEPADAHSLPHDAQLGAVEDREHHKPGYGHGV